MNRIVNLGIAAAVVAAPGGAMAGAVEVCHQTGAGKSMKITTSEAALKAHQGHGDWVVTEEICGVGIDNACDGQIDACVSTCPCFSQAEFDLAVKVVTTYAWTDVLGAVGCESAAQGYYTVQGNCGVRYDGDAPSGTYVRSVTPAEATACMKTLVNWCSVIGPILASTWLLERAHGACCRNAPARRDPKRGVAAGRFALRRGSRCCGSSA